MNIKLLAQKIEIVKVNEDAQLLNPNNAGVSLNVESKIAIDGKDSFPTLIHEITHQFMYKTGQRFRNAFTIEDVSESFGFLTKQLMLENGNDIFQKLKEFAES